MNDFSEKLIAWFKTASRDLPWRKTTDPYLIWVSEVILQQTRVAQGLSYYQAFTGAFPTVQALADGSEDEILRLWQGLGYYSRARNMHHTAKEVVARFQGIFPTNYQDLISLKGIGPYTASAISSFSANESQAVLDGNVFRVLARYLDIKTDITTTAAKTQFQKAATELLSSRSPGLHNQAIMELGAVICKVGEPLCLLCPVNNSCASAYKPEAKDLPLKAAKKEVRLRKMVYLFHQENDAIWLRKRTGQDVWKGLYEFVLLDDRFVEKGAEPDNFLNQGILQSSNTLQMAFQTQHKLTHQTIEISLFSLADNAGGKELDQKLVSLGYEKYSIEQAHSLAKPIVLAKFWQTIAGD